MTDFIEGAAYVSPSRQELYSSDGDGLYTRGGDWVDPTVKGFPTDLVMIWAPGDEVRGASLWSVIFRGKAPSEAGPLTEPPVELKVKPDAPTEVRDDSRPNPNWSTFKFEQSISNPDVVTIPCPDGRPGCAVLHTMKRSEWVARQKQESLKSRGWYYPTRYNEKPGRYEDERGRIWEHRAIPDKPAWFAEEGPYENYVVPADERGLLHVRWVGELDD